MKKNQIIEIIIAILFTFLGGFADAYTFILRGGTFATMQTGNLIKFFINLSNGTFLLMYLLPIVFFILGCMLSVLLSKLKFYHLVSLILLFVIYLTAGFCPKTEAWDIVCVSSLSVAGALQFEAFNRCLAFNYTSTMCTNNMKLFSNNLIEGKFKTAFFYLLIIGVFASGLVGAVFLNKAVDIYSICIIASLFIPILILWLLNKEERTINLKNAE